MNNHRKHLLRRLLPRTVRPQRILGGPLRGMRIVTSLHDYPAAILGRTEQPLLVWFEKNVNVGETWLDVGAHYGYTAIALSRSVGAMGRVFAFEPMLSTAGYLAQTRIINDLRQLTVVPMGLDNGKDQSLAVRHFPATRGMVDSTLPKGGWGESFIVASLDWLWPRLCGKKETIHGIKVDVQGMELEVLRGMIRILTTKKPKLVIELHEGVDRVNLRSVIEAAGYVGHGVPIDPAAGEVRPLYLDNRSYAFFPSDGTADNMPNP